MKGHFKSFAAAASCSLMLAFSRSAQAQVITLHDNNSTAVVDTGSQSGMFHWDVQGQNQLVQQWFWYRVGVNPEQSIDTLNFAPKVISSTANTLSTTYFGNGFNIQLTYQLTGGAVVTAGQVGTADVAETIKVNNTTGTPLDFHLFQYSDFDLGGAGNDIVSLSTNSHGLFNEADQNDNGAVLIESVTGVTPGANHGEVAFFNNTLNKLNNGTPDNLNDSAGPVGPGDVTWALQWDLSVGANNSKIVSKDKQLNVGIVPEPSSFALLGLGLAAFTLRKKRA
ncbi:MAG TPA: PEP-CTERM sorting domain-containing protein [Candidatus Dormibacteraeota bacterium]|nr:PEP-CTERM sorting domain-containing protein [Candidatus Dormibacteraeota bacterium]